MTEISAMYEALDNMDDYALMANVKPIGPHKVLTDAIAELEKLRQRVAELESQLAKNNPLLDEAASHIDAMENYIDDVCTVICDPYKWCDDIDVLRRIEKLLRDGTKLLGDK